jgi:predicted PurR-regulated permease PerM
MSHHKAFGYLRYVPLIVVVLVFYKLINQTDLLVQSLRTITSLLLPIVWGIVIAYLLNPIMNFFEQQLRFPRGLAVLTVYLIVFGGIISGLTVVIPKIVASMSEIISEAPKYMELLTTWYYLRLEDLEALEAFARTYNVSLETLMGGDLISRLRGISENLTEIIMGTGRAVFDITSGIFKFIMGLVMSIYMLKDKRKFNEAGKKILLAYFGPVRSEQIVEVGRDINRVFSRYLVGKTVDSIIIGLLCFFGLRLLNVRFAMLLALIVGITNMIPYFGPFIGAIPAVGLTLFSSPVQALWVALFILALQQLDGYIIGPKILGDSVGLSPFWIIVAILIGGGLFGVVGMLICVPLLAVIRNLNTSFMDKRIQRFNDSNSISAHVESDAIEDEKVEQEGVVTE